jgi:hypothetical protein
MSNFPTDLDNDLTIPSVSGNITEIGEDILNALKDAVINIESNIGVGAAGTQATITQRLNNSLNPDGSLKSSALAAAGLITLPITDSQISAVAAIKESKLDLNYPTNDLFNLISNLGISVTTLTNWLSLIGVKLDPHILGLSFKHNLDHIVVSTVEAELFKDKLGNYRSDDAYVGLKDLNDESVYHQKADGTGGAVGSVTTNDGSRSYPATHAHIASGIYVDSAGFANIPRTEQDVQAIFDYLDTTNSYSNLIKNLYSNGISKESRSSRLDKNIDGVGVSIVPTTQVHAYLLNSNATSPVDSITTGDDVIKFTPSLPANEFDAYFTNVRIGDILTIDYGSVKTSFLIKEKKYAVSGPNRSFYVRIEGKNLLDTEDGYASIDRSLVNSNKLGVLALSALNQNNNTSVLVGSPKGAQALGIGFDASQLDQDHYNLYLTIYNDGTLASEYKLLAIDVTGNAGATPGKYTLESVVENVNNAFRTNGFNYRFIAFSHKGEFGIMLADSYNNCGFSIISVYLDNAGLIDTVQTALNLPKNVIDVQNNQDALGLGPDGSNVASPPYQAYTSVELALHPTKIILPLTRNNFYVNGTERSDFEKDIDQAIDDYGDGYWKAKIVERTAAAGKIQTKYAISLDLRLSKLIEGKTVVVQPDESTPVLNQTQYLNYGRFIIESVDYTACVGLNPVTNIVVVDGVHNAPGISVVDTNLVPIDGYVRLYFCGDTAVFNDQNLSDQSAQTGFKRYHEIMINESGETFAQERARFSVSGNKTINGQTLRGTVNSAYFDILNVSNKLRGDLFGDLNKITLKVNSVSVSTGEINCVLCKYDGTNISNIGPVTIGKIGQVFRAYDNTNIEFIDFVFNAQVNVTNEYFDVQLFPTLSLDNEIMLLGSCQQNETGIVNIVDRRQFGTISEKDLTTSALDYISETDALLHGSGIISGFDLVDQVGLTNPNTNKIYLQGGKSIVNGKVVLRNSETLHIPPVKELYNGNYYSVNFAVCLNSNGDYNLVPLLDYNNNLFNSDVSLTSLNTYQTPDTDRQFTAFNNITSNSYILNASRFSDLIKDNKVTVLYVVNSLLGGSGVGTTYDLHIFDIRKYVNNVNNVVPVVYSGSKEQSNFRSLTAAINYAKLNKNNGNSNKIYLNGINESVTDIRLVFDKYTVIDGGNDSEITVNGSIKFGKNLLVKNTKFIINTEDRALFDSINGVNTVSDLTFENCDLTINSTSLASYTDITSARACFQSELNNIKFINCNITSNLGGYGNDGRKLIDINGGSGWVLDSCKFVLNTIYEGSNPAISDDGYVPVSGIRIGRGSSNITINNCTFEGNYLTGIFITGSNTHAIANINNINITKCIFNQSYGPKDGGISNAAIGDQGSSTTAYAVGDSTIVLRQGYLTGAGTSLDFENINIKECVFNYTGQYNYHFPFIKLLSYPLESGTNALQAANNFVRNIEISKNTFKSQTSIDGTFDPYTAIIFATRQQGTSTDLTKRVELENILISGNICRNQQQIILACPESVDGSSGTVVKMFGATNVIIEGNTAEVIGYLLTNSIANSRRGSNIVIRNNTASFIGSVNAEGKFARAWSAHDTLKYKYSSANAIIEGNNCNHIHAMVTGKNTSSLKINNNTLTSGVGFNLFTTYDDGLDNPDEIIYKSSLAAIYVTSSPTTGTTSNGITLSNDMACIISNNTICPNIIGADTYKYNYGIMCESSALIENNTIKEVVDSATISAGIVVKGKTYNINNNYIEKTANTDIKAYILGSDDVWSGFNGSSGTIKFNSFNDKSTIDTNPIEVYNEAIQGFNGSFTINNNKNQWGRIAIPLTQEFFQYGGDGFGAYHWTNTDSVWNVGKLDYAPVDVKSELGINITSMFDFDALHNSGDVYDRVRSASNTTMIRVRKSASSTNKFKCSWQIPFNNYINDYTNIKKIYAYVRAVNEDFGTLPTVSSTFTYSLYKRVNINTDTENLDSFDLVTGDGFGSAYSNNATDLATIAPTNPKGNLNYIVSDTISGLSVPASQPNSQGNLGKSVQVQFNSGGMYVSPQDVDLYTHDGNDYVLTVNADIKIPSANQTVFYLLSPIVVEYVW